MKLEIKLSHDETREMLEMYLTRRGISGETRDIWSGSDDCGLATVGCTVEQATLPPLSYQKPAPAP